MKPKERPKLSPKKVRELIVQQNVTSPVAILGIRGYYRRTMGHPESNDRGVYDDALFVVTPNRVTPFNGNTDPSSYRPGIATLRPGVYPYRRGRHGISRPSADGSPAGYPALRPATPGEALPVDRDGVKNPRPGIAINIHRGGTSSTSSEGCQTVPPDQWDEFLRTVSEAMEDFQIRTVPYVLIENDGSLG